jgi:hypothetical protein
LAVDDWALEKLLTFDADAADLEDGGDDEPDACKGRGDSAGAGERERPEGLSKRWRLSRGETTSLWTSGMH